MSLPFADAATIVRAHQKDAYFESSYRNQLQELISFIQGQRFVNTHPEEITVLAKSAYLLLTTLIGARTLGEEYVDLVYVNRTGKRLPGLRRRAGFVLAYALVPYLVSRAVRRLRPSDEADIDREPSPWKRILLRASFSYTRILDTLLNIHVALFYFRGEFYSLSKRIFGMRYAFGHSKEQKSVRGNYAFLGGLIMVQYGVKALLLLQREQKEETVAQDKSVVADISQLRVDIPSVELDDPTQLPYIPRDSRSCMLCLSPMTDPSAANCGHLFCWECIVDWVREHPECPLCRQVCREENLVCLR